MPDTTENPRQNVTFPSNGGEAHGYLATPPSGNGPGLIVIQEWWGLDDHIADVTDRFSREGYVALAPDLYGGKLAHDENEAMNYLMSLDVQQAAKDLSGAVDFLLARDDVSGNKIGVVGYCMGGGFVLLLAANAGDKIAAAVPYYGVGPGVENADLSGITADVQGHYGEQDEMFPVQQVREFEQKLREQAKGEVTFYYYPAGHAFHNDENKIGNYDKDAAQQAWQRTLEFIQAKLGS
ncbi:MAG: dienelactone hydrolase family protein [Actinomycetes bacterium]